MYAGLCAHSPVMARRTLMLVLSKRAVVFGAIALIGLGGVSAPAAAATESGWRIASAASEHPGDGLSGIAATGPDDAWAVGTAPCCGADARKLSHWNGVAWQPFTLPAAPEGALEPTLSTVGASSPDDVW